MATTVTPRLRKFALISAFALFAVLLGWGVIMASQAATFFGAVCLVVVFVSIILDAGHVPRPDEEADDELEWR